MVPILRIGVRSLGILERNAVAFPILKSNSLESRRNIVDTSKLLSHNLVRQATPLAVREYSKHVKPQKKVEKNKHRSESDSEFHSSSDSGSDQLLGHRGESEFWRRKMRTFHGILDVNNDGVISYDDFKLLADRFVNLGHLSENKSKEFHRVIKDLWEKLFGEITPYNLVTVERYLEDMHHVLNDRPLKKKAHSFLPFLFKAIDKNNTGKFSLEDHKLFFNCLGLHEVDAVFSFRTIDKNADGKITLNEFVKNGRRFFLTEDQECISKYFWGPLVDH